MLCNITQMSCHTCMHANCPCFASPRLYSQMAAVLCDKALIQMCWCMASYASQERARCYLEPGCSCSQAHDSSPAGLGLPAQRGVHTVIAVWGDLAHGEFRQQGHAPGQPRCATCRFRHNKQGSPMPLPAHAWVPAQQGTHTVTMA